MLEISDDGEKKNNGMKAASYTLCFFPVSVAVAESAFLEPIVVSVS